MQIGIGLPSQVPGVTGTTLLDFARRAEARGFASLYTSDRLVWSSFDPLATLAAVGGATERIGLNAVVLGPLRANHALFASTIASVDHLASPGRLRLSLSPGPRPDDFERSSLDFHARGRQLDALLDELEHSWRDDDGVGPKPATPGGPPLLFAASSAPALRRITTRGAGWLAGPGIEQFETFSAQVRKGWRERGRSGSPILAATCKYALGKAAEESMRHTTRGYYSFAGPDMIAALIDETATTPQRIVEEVEAYERAGCNELYFLSQHDDPAQIDQLADVLGDRLG